MRRYLHATGAVRGTRRAGAAGAVIAALAVVPLAAWTGPSAPAALVERGITGPISSAVHGAPANRRSTGQCLATTRSAFRANASKRAARQMAPESSWQPATDQTRSSGKFPVSSAFPVMNSSIRGRASAWRTRVSPRLTAPRSSSIRAAGRPLRPGIHRARPADRFPREGARHSAPRLGRSLSRHAAPRALLFTWLAMGSRSQQGHLPLSTAKQIKQSGMAPPLAPEMPCPSTSNPQTPW